MKYLTLGTKEITEEKFNKIKNRNSNLKPTGGLWLTQYCEETYNPWIDYILENSYLFFYKYKYNFEQDCSIITLKNNTKIINLNNNTFDYLLKEYPNNNVISYEKLSEDYDGIYVDLFKLKSSTLNEETKRNLNTFGVNTLLLFNLKCIDYYQSGTVKIAPFDYDTYIKEPYYEIEYDNIKKKILKR